MRCPPACAALLAAFLITSCGTGGHAGHAPPPTPVASASGFNGTDAAWLQLMIPMAGRALPMLDLGARRGSTPEVRELAASLAGAHRDELDRLRELRAAAGLPDVNVHEGHDMPGMATAARLDAMRGARGKAFDRLFLESVRAHLDQSVKVTRGERDSGADPRALAMAADLERTRTEQLKALSAVE
ncbi:DUF305 domain-containing protein [Nonomuraea harbinensis]|uniref:DUF305 domain-containing protein n=1 Tax=Nonomuraea harbinensis TaxID=1286938 RepID=A0ABW1BP65_9ACTN|nr:DUF305 domain-containing protein [Nonomuraea harbinensis]